MLVARIVQADRPTADNRTYSLSILQEIVDQNNDKLVYGQLGFPDGGSIDLTTVSHVVRNLRIETDWLVGDVEILGTPAGKTLTTMIDELPIRFRMAGYGKVNEDSSVTNFIIHSICAVIDWDDVDR